MFKAWCGEGCRVRGWWEEALGAFLAFCPARRARARTARTVSLSFEIVDETSGSPTLRHAPLYDGFVAASGPRQEVAEAIDRHIEQHFGPVAYVLHEVASHLVGVHVYVVEPTAERPFQTLITSGMSEQPMTLPDGHAVSPYAEVML